MRGPEVFLLLLFIAVPWILGWISKNHWAHQRYLKALELRAEANNRILDRLGSDPAALELLKTDAHSASFEAALKDPGPSRSLPYTRMLTALQIGLVLLSAGFGFIWLSSHLGLPDVAGAGADTVHNLQAYRSRTEPLLIFGTIGVALGIGSLLSALAALIVGRVWNRLSEDGPVKTGTRSH
jgi:biotin transporter BioY